MVYSFIRRIPKTRYGITALTHMHIFINENSRKT